MQGITEDLDNKIQEIIERLNEVELEDIEKEYIRTADLKPKNFPWYKMYDGPQDIQRLAEHVGDAFTYEIIYRYMSKYIHGSNILKSGLSESSLTQLRSPEHFHMVFQQSVNWFLKSLELLYFQCKKDGQKKYSEYCLQIRDQLIEYEIIKP